MRDKHITVLVIWGIGGILWGLFTAQWVPGQTLSGVECERTRITLGFQVKPEVVQSWLPAPWQLNPLGSGPLKGTNFSVLLMDRVRDETPDGKSTISGTNLNIVFNAPGKHPQTGQTVSVILGGWAGNPARVPGYYRIYRQATMRVEQLIKSQVVHTEEVSDVWQVQDTAGGGELELRLQSRRNMSARTRAKGEPNAISAKDPALWRIYKFDALTDVVKSGLQGIDQMQGYSFRLTGPQFGKLFDGTEQLVGITVAPWYMRQVFVR